MAESTVHTSDQVKSHPRVTVATDHVARNYDETVEFYKTWSAAYDKEMLGADYGGPILCAEYMNKHAERLGWEKSCRILDAAAGTGLVSQMLREKYGFTNIDAADGSQEMLDAAKEHNLYVNYICTCIGDGARMPIEDNTYDALTMSGGFADGHLKCDALLEFVRVIRKGGLIVNVMRDKFTQISDELSKLLPLYNKLMEEGKLARIEEVVIPEKYLLGFDARVQVYQKL